MGGEGERGGGRVRKHKCAFNNTPSSCHYLFFLARCFCHPREQNSHSVFLQEFSVRLALERLPTQTSRSEGDLLGLKRWRAQNKKKKASRVLSKNVKSCDKPDFSRTFTHCGNDDWNSSGSTCRRFPYSPT